MKMSESRFMYSILAGFTIGGWLFGGWLFATEPGVGTFAFFPGIAMAVVAFAFYAADSGRLSDIADKTEAES
jgi:hypothetical protein